MTPELFQLPRSHFNEKARWGFDFKAIPHRRITMLAGLQRPRIQKISGQPLIPVARFGTDIAAGSAQILDALEQRYPEPPLYPSGIAQCQRALEIQRYFDDRVGPLARRGVFSWLLNRPDYFCRVFAEHASWPRRIGFRAAIGAAIPRIRKMVGLIDEASVEEAMVATREGLDFVAEHTEATGYLIGDHFGIADLTAAALLALTIDTGHPAMAMPRPAPPEYEEWLERWRPHPGAKWVRSMYDKHRPPSSALS
jgi:glutathione S-transferase